VLKRLTGEDDVGQPPAAVGVQHVGPHVGVLQAAAQPRQGGLRVVEQRGGRVEVRAAARRHRAHGVLQQSELVQLDGEEKNTGRTRGGRST